MDRSCADCRGHRRKFNPNQHVRRTQRRAGVAFWAAYSNNAAGKRATFTGARLAAARAAGRQGKLRSKRVAYEKRNIWRLKIAGYMAKRTPSKASSGKSLVIVESPAKAKTISKFLGGKYTVEASIGHIRDLPQGAKELPQEFKGETWAYLGVNVNDNFAGLYRAVGEEIASQQAEATAEGL